MLDPKNEFQGKTASSSHLGSFIALLNGGSVTDELVERQRHLHNGVMNVRK